MASLRGSARGCGCGRARPGSGDACARTTWSRGRARPRVTAPFSACRRRRRSRSASAATSDGSERDARDPGLGRLAAGRGAPPRGRGSGQRDVHLEAAGVSNRRAPGDVHRELGRGQRDAHARDPGRAREQAAARACESGRRLPAAGAAQRAALGNVWLGVRPAPHDCPHRPIPLGSRDHRRSRSGRPSSTGTRSRCSTR